MLDAVSGGRAFLGLAKGAWLDKLGIEEERPLAALREAVAVITALLAGDEAGFAGERFTLEPGTALAYARERDLRAAHDRDVGAGDGALGGNGCGRAEAGRQRQSRSRPRCARLARQPRGEGRGRRGQRRRRGWRLGSRTSACRSRAIPRRRRSSRSRRSSSSLASLRRSTGSASRGRRRRSPSASSSSGTQAPTASSSARRKDGRRSPVSASSATASSRCFATERIRYGDPHVVGHARPRAAARDVPRRTHGVLLPDARVGRRRGRRAGDVHPRVARLRPLRGPLRASLLALPDRDERLLRHARQPQASGTADGSRAFRRADRREPADARPALDRADARQSRRRRGRSGGDHRRARVGAARVRRRAPAPAASTACGSHPLRGASLEGERGRRAPRDERRIREQRAPARSRDARGERRDPFDDGALRRQPPTRSSSAATSRRSSSTTWTL